jgi:Tol biopolymer transport system component
MERPHEYRRKRITRYPIISCGSPSLLGVAALLILALTLVACGSPSSSPAQVRVQGALPTPTTEPTFTPSPAPKLVPTASATVAPTPTKLNATAGLTGRILDQATGKPIANATVSAGIRTATTDAEGRYTLTDLPPGQFALSVTRDGYDPALSAIVTLTAGQPLSLDLTLYTKDTSPYPQDPMLTNPLDPAGAPTAKDAERLARLQGLTGDVTKVEETKLRGTYLVNYKRGGEVRAAVASLDHDAWALTDAAGQTWWIIKVCGNLARLVPSEVKIATPQPRSLPPLAQVLAEGVSVRACASEACTVVGTLAQGKPVEVLGCLADGGWCQVGLPGGKKGWCTGKSLRQLAVATAVPVVEAVLPTAIPGAATGEEKIAFLSNRDHLNDPSAFYELYTMNPDSSQQKRITTKGLFESSLAWLPGHSQLFYGTIGNNLGIINLSDGTPVPLELPAPSRGHAGFVDLSPDGSRLAFVYVGGSSCNVFVVNVDGTDYRQLTDSQEKVLASYPSWSPNGDKLAFSIQDSRPGQILHTFWVMLPDGTAKVKLADVMARASAWSPDGKKIAFECWLPETSYKTAQDICVINSDGTNLIPLTHEKEFAWHPTWSPDGKQIAFYIQAFTNGKIEAQIYLVNIDGTGQTQLTSEGNNCCPAWSR